MARSRGTKEYLPPFKGLNTSLSPRAESEEFFTDGLNMRYRENPARLEPRKGFSITKYTSPGAAPSGNSVNQDISYGEWRNPNNDTNKSFLWVKIGKLLYFIDVDTEVVHTEIIDLEDALSGTTFGVLANLEEYPIDARNVKGNLLVVGPATDPVLLQWDGSNLEGFVLNLLIRDTLGLEDGLQVDERPATLSDEHEYNLYNQGWYKERRITASGAPTDPIAAFFTDQAVYPSNADISHLAVVDDGAGEILFDTDFLLDLSFGSSPAPRGHYVLDAFNINREGRRSSPEVSGLTSGGSGDSAPSESTPTPPPEIYPPEGEILP